MGKKETKGSEGAVGGKAVNNVINILLAIGCLTILFPIYMTVIIAFKKPSEMTNDVAGALGFPASWSFDNFAEAMRVTDFWRSLGNSLLLTGVTVIICVLFLHCKRYVRALCSADDAFGKTDVPDGDCKPVRRDCAVCGVLYAYEHYAVFRVPEKYPHGAGRSSLCGRRKHLADLLENYLPDYETYARNRCSPDCNEHMERRYDAAGYYVRQRREYAPAGTA